MQAARRETPKPQRTRTEPTTVSKDSTMTVDITACTHCNTTQGIKWKPVCRAYLCATCQTLPEYKQICRSTAMNKYGLTFDALHTAWKAGRIRMTSVKNPYGPQLPPMRLYIEAEIKRLAQQKQIQPTNPTKSTIKPQTSRPAHK